MIRRVGLVCFCAVLLAAGQETRGTIYGRILDPQGSVISTATVSVTNRDTNTSQVLKTNETGYYEANLLLPGNYQVSLGAAGFRKLSAAELS